MPPPFPIIRARLDRALAEHDLAAFRRAARELPGAVTLADALQVLLLMLESDDPAFDAGGGPLDQPLHRRMPRRRADGGPRRR